MKREDTSTRTAAAGIGHCAAVPTHVRRFPVTRTTAFAIAGFPVPSRRVPPISAVVCAAADVDIVKAVATYHTARCSMEVLSIRSLELTACRDLMALFVVAAVLQDCGGQHDTSIPCKGRSSTCPGHRGARCPAIGAARRATMARRAHPADADGRGRSGVERGGRGGLR